MNILNGKVVAKQIKTDLKNYFSKDEYKNKYIALILIGEDAASQVYVTMKRKFGNSIGLNIEVFGDTDLTKSYEVDQQGNKSKNEISNSKFATSQAIANKNLNELEELLEAIELLNQDNDCLGIMVQLPLPDHLMSHKPQILAKISPLKDIDGLGGMLMGMGAIDYIDFIPATPSSVLALLEYYNLADFSGKTVSIIGQSNLVGKPLAMEIIKRFGTVYSFNHLSDTDEVKAICRRSDYIISATGCVHLIDDSYLRDSADQILVDVGYGILNGKAVGDINFEKVDGKIGAISPVPGGVGPLTVACLFKNVKKLLDQKQLIDG